jgi:hypothetical protein
MKSFYCGRSIPSCISTVLKASLTVILTCQLFCINEASGQGDLLLTPRRLVFDGTKRSIDLNLANTGQDTATYAISLMQIRMREDGGFETITAPDSGQRFADRYIRFFPRQVTLGPNESQVVKVQLIRSGELQPGEYRSHFYFRSIPKPKPMGEAEPVRDTNNISVSITPIFGITIPVIIRTGESNAKIILSDLKLDVSGEAGPILKMVFYRTGNISVYGDLTIDYISPDGKATRVGIANGVAVYTPNTKRQFQLNLNKVEGVDFNTGKLRILFSAPSDVKPIRYAETELMLHK